VATATALALPAQRDDIASAVTERRRGRTQGLREPTDGFGTEWLLAVAVVRARSHVMPRMCVDGGKGQQRTATLNIRVEGGFAMDGEKVPLEPCCPDCPLN